MPNLLVRSADSQWVIATSGTSTFSSAIWRAAVVAPLVWPETTSRSGLSAFTLVSVADMSERSRGSLSSMTMSMPYFFASSTTPARTSSENGSFSKAMAMRTSPGFLPLCLATSAARSIALFRYCSEVDSTANRYW